MSTSFPTVCFEATELKKPDGTPYHTIPAEECRMAIVTRKRLNGPDEHEAAFVRGGGAWLPPVFR